MPNKSINSDSQKRRFASLLAADYAERSSGPLGVYSRNAHFYASII